MVAFVPENPTGVEESVVLGYFVFMELVWFVFESNKIIKIIIIAVLKVFSSEFHSWQY